MILDGGLVRRRREELGLSMRALAAQLGTSGPTIARLEAGNDHDDIPLGLADRLADAISVDLPTLALDRRKEAQNVHRAEAHVVVEQTPGEFSSPPVCLTPVIQLPTRRRASHRR